MTFTEKRRRRPRNLYREWLDETGHYRITWRRICDLIEPGYYAAVRCVRPVDGFLFWDFCGAARPYRTFEAAVKSADRHQRMIEKCIKVASNPGAGRAEKLKELNAKCVFGTKGNENNILGGIPVWAWEANEVDVLKHLFPILREKRK